MNQPTTPTSQNTPTNNDFLAQLDRIMNGPFNDEYRQFLQIGIEKTLTLQEAFELYVKTKTICILNPLRLNESDSQTRQNLTQKFIQIGYILDYSETIPESFTVGVRTDFHRALISILDQYSTLTHLRDAQFTISHDNTNPLHGGVRVSTRGLIVGRENFISLIGEKTPKESLIVYRKLHSALYDLLRSQDAIANGRTNSPPGPTTWIPDDVLSVMQGASSRYIDRPDVF